MDAGGDTAARVVTEARAVSDPSTGEVTASAETTVEGTSIGGLLRLGRVHSSARVRRSPAGDDDLVESTFEIEPFRVGDLRVAVTPAGLEVLGAGGLTLPGVDVVKQVLGSAGISMQFLEATEIDGGVISAGLAISMLSPAPDPLNGTITITYGRVRAVASATGSGEPPIDGPLVDAGTPSFEGDLPALDTPAVVASSPEGAPAPTELAGGVRPVASTASAASFYLVLVLGAVAAVIGAVLFRYLALKVVWS